jgi:hypothetical protein
MAELTLEQKRAIALAKAKVAASKGKTGVVDQFGSGLNEGIAAALGLPVDMATKAINAIASPSDVEIPLKEDMTAGDAKITPRGPLVSQPFGGSETFKGLLDPLISDVAPQNMGQRFARRGGQELGFGVPASLVGARFIPGAQEGLPAYLGASAAGDVGAAVGGQTSREIAPNNDTADLIASMIGGAGGAGLVSMLMPKTVRAPTLDETKAKAADKWAAVENANVTLTPQASQEYVDRIARKLVDERATDTRLYPRANAAAEGIADNTDRSLYGLIQDRRFVGRSVAADPNESAVGVAMKGEINDYLKSLDPTKVRGTDPQGAVDEYLAANELTSRVKRAEQVLNKEMRGESRAATSGTGGNEVNAQRQNIRSLLDIERDPTLRGKSKGFTPDEVAQMERIVYGTPGSNAARLLGRFAPNSGALPLLTTGYGGAAGAAAAAATGNPLLAAPAAIGGIGLAAKSAAESMTKREIKKLLDMILSGGKLAPSTSRPAASRAVVEQLITNALSGAQ